MSIELIKLKKWLALNKLSLSILKTNYIVFGKVDKDELINVSIDEFILTRVCSTKLLGVQIDEGLNCKEYTKLVYVHVFFYSLISNLKTYHRTLHFTPWSLDPLIHLPFQLPGNHTVLHLFRCIELIEHIAISVLPGTHFHLSQVKHLGVKCLAQGHTILTMSQD